MPRNMPSLDEDDDETTLAAPIEDDDDEVEGGESFLDVNLADVPALHIARAGETRLRCYKASIKTSNGEKTRGQKMLFLNIEHADDPAVKDMTYVVMLPFQGIEEKQRIRRLNQLKETCDAFGVDYTRGVNIADFPGQEGYGILTVENTPEYGPQNRIQRFVTGPGEGGNLYGDDDEEEE